MATRKETPDVLAEILSGTTPALAQPAAAPAPPASTPRAARKPAQRQEPRPATSAPASPESKPAVWEYLVVSFQDHRGWRPRYINGNEIRDWMRAPLLHDYIAELAEDGWELVASAAGKTLYGSSDHYQLYFRHPKK